MSRGTRREIELNRRIEERTSVAEGESRRHLAKLFVRRTENEVGCRCFFLRGLGTARQSVGDGRRRWPEPSLKERVHGDFARTEEKNQDRGDQKGVWCGGVELVGVGKDGEERLSVSGDIGHDHVDRQDKRREA